jgi:transposase
MATRELQIKESIKRLKKKIRNENNANVRDRMRIILYVAKGMTDLEISNKIGFSIQWVWKWISRYKANGLNGLFDLPRSGAPTALTENQMMSLFIDILDGPGPGDILSRFRISDIQELIFKKFGINYSYSGTHVLMKRMKLSHVKPRPAHPKNDPEIMKDWKKKPKNLLME